MLAASLCCVDAAVPAKFREAREQSQALGEIMCVHCFIVLCGHRVLLAKFKEVKNKAKL